MSGSRAAHWKRVYAARDPTALSWYEPVPARSLELIAATGIAPTAPILDVGGGASLLVDCLLERGFTAITVLDIAAPALARARARLGGSAGHVRWRTGDVLEWGPERRYALWHDRAAFHFLTDPADQAGYVARVQQALRPGGWLILATFGPDGPRRCSGLPTCRYAASDLGTRLGATFRLQAQSVERHTTPAGRSQEFLYTLWRVAGGE